MIQSQSVEKKVKKMLKIMCKFQTGVFGSMGLAIFELENRKRS